MFGAHHHANHLRRALTSEDAEELAKLQIAADKSDSSSADEHLKRIAISPLHRRASLESELERAASGLGTSSDEEPATSPRTRSKSAYIKVLGQDELEPDHEHVNSHFYIGENDVIDSMGVSGLCILAHSEGFYEKCTLVSIALQAFLMQFVIFYFMWLYIREAEHPSPSDAAGPVKRSILMIAIYVHIMNILRDIPFSLSVLFTFPWLQHGWKESLYTAPVFMIDSVIVPFVTAVLGSLYLCTSKTTAGLLLNSCAVCFVNGIDNSLLKLSRSFKEFSRFRAERIVFIPYQPKMATCLDYSVVVFPVIPVLLAVIIVWIGRDCLGLYYPEDEDVFV